MCVLKLRRHKSVNAPKSPFCRMSDPFPTQKTFQFEKKLTRNRFKRARKWRKYAPSGDSVLCGICTLVTVYDGS